MLPGWQNPWLVGQMRALKRINMFLEKQPSKPGLATEYSIAQSLTSCCRICRVLKQNLILDWHQWIPVPDIMQAVIVQKTNEALWLDGDWVINVRDRNLYRLLYIYASLSRCLRCINGWLLKLWGLETSLIFKMKITKYSRNRKKKEKR